MAFESYVYKIAARTRTENFMLVMGIAHLLKEINGSRR